MVEELPVDFGSQYFMLIQLDPCIAKAPIILGQEKSDDDSVVKWIREEFTELKQVRNDSTE